jgi:hypothetical protein
VCWSSQDISLRSFLDSAHELVQPSFCDGQAFAASALAALDLRSHVWNVQSNKRGNFC